MDNDVLGLVGRRTQILVWLDRIDKFDADGVSVALLRKLRTESPGRRVIATIPSGDRYARWVADNADLAEEFGAPVIVERLPVTAAELQRAQALYPGLDFSEGIAAAFTTAAGLLQRMRAGNFNCEHDACAGDCVLARVVVACAMEWAGTGTSRPLPVDRVSSLVQQRLTLPDPPDPTHLSMAIRWAAAPIAEGDSLLRTQSRDGSTLAVVAHSEIAEIVGTQPAEGVWVAALDDAVAANDSDAIGRIGFRAHVGNHLEEANLVWAKVRSEEEPAAKWLLEAAQFSRVRRDPTMTHLAAEERLLALAEAAHGPQSVQVANCLCSVGGALNTHRRHHQALENLERGRTIMEGKADADPSLLAGIYANMGNAWSRLGSPQTARDLYEKSVAIYTQVFGDQSQQVATILTNLGITLLRLDDPVGARKHHEDAIAIHTHVYGEESTQVAIDRINLGHTWIQLGDAEKARQIYEQALPIIRRELGGDNVVMASLQVGLGDAWLKLHRPDRAKEFYERALEIKRSKFGDDSSEVASAMAALGQAYKALGRHQPALDNLNKALPILEREFGEDHQRLQVPLLAIAQAWNALGDLVTARRYYERLLRVLEKRYGDDDPRIIGTLDDIATTWISEGDNDRARDVLARALHILKKQFPRGQDTLERLRKSMSLADPDAIVLDNGEVLRRSQDGGDSATPDVRRP